MKRVMMLVFPTDWSPRKTSLYLAMGWTVAVACMASPPLAVAVVPVVAPSIRALLCFCSAAAAVRKLCPSCSHVFLHSFLCAREAAK